MLTPEELHFYEENGFLLKKQLIPLEWIEQIKSEIENIHERMAAQPVEGIHVSWEVYDDPNKPKRIKQLMHSELVSPTLNRALRCDAMLDVVEALMGCDISLYHSKLLLKAARDGTAVPWHQDYAYWVREDNRPLMMNCQLAIDAATKENGCIQFIPGSHRWGLQEHERKQMTFGVFLPGPAYYYERDDAVDVEMQPGDGVFFGPLVVHGSAPNTSDQDRRMNTFAYNVTGNNMTQCREALRGKSVSSEQ
jgi:ectoine hydroxylase-related dioxygenase (phytanoyl-CoA dioxygenase family)